MARRKATGRAAVTANATREIEQFGDRLDAIATVSSVRLQVSRIVGRFGLTAAHASLVAELAFASTPQ